MRHSFTLAVRNLLRNRRRSVTTLLAMVVGICAILLFGGYSRDITYSLQTDFVQRSGHLQIQRRGYFLYGSGNTAAYGIRGYDRLLNLLRADPELAPMLVVATPTLQLGGIAGNFAQGVSRTVFAQGLIADDQSRLREWNDYGFPLRPRASGLTGTPDNAVLIGHGVARVLQLCTPLNVADCPQPDAALSEAPPSAPSDAPADIAALSTLEAPPASATAGTPHVEVLSANARGAPNVGSFIVASAERQGVKELDDVYLAMHLPRAQRLVYGSEEPQVTAIILQLRHTSQLTHARTRVESLLREHFGSARLEVQDFATLNPFYDQANRMFAAIFGFVFVLIGAIVLFVVSNTMSMVIVERTVEIGTLRAVGLRRSGIQSLFIAEGVVLGVTGAALGVAVALALSWAINHSGLHWTPPARVESIPLTVRVWGEWALISLSVIGMVLLTAVSAWWPARSGSRMHIVDALRHV